MQIWSAMPQKRLDCKAPAGMDDAITGPVLSAAQMRAAETAAINAALTTGAALMEAAGQATVTAIGRFWPDLVPGAALVLAGPGNNGGDGFVIARLLAAQGWQTRLFLLGDPARLPPDAALNARLWAAGHVTERLDRLDDGRIAAALMPGMLIVDALFGTGLTRPVAGLESLAAHLAKPGLRRVAVDIPTGLHADSGASLGGSALPADLTVTFHAPKYGHFIGEGPRFCGNLAVAGIGLPPDRAPGTAILAGSPPAGVVMKTSGHKYQHGHALILGGDSGHCGAVRLAARAALRMGSGLVTLASAPGAVAENAAACPDAVMLAPVAGAGDLWAILSDRRLNALCLGPGLGPARARALTPEALATDRPAVLDADSITAFADAPRTLFDLLDPDTVLTPHEGEFARLFPDLAADLDDPLTSRVDVLRKAARRAGCVVLLKGPVTIIAAPDGRLALHPAVYHQAALWLATAGAGDVLAGMITGLLARGVAGFEASCHACWLHAACARAIGPGLIADDLPDALPGILAGIQAGQVI